MADTATLQARLSEAEAALHDVTIGGKVVTISSNGRAVNYSPANADSLRRYIRELKVALGIPRGVATVPFF